MVKLDFTFFTGLQRIIHMHTGLTASCHLSSRENTSITFLYSWLLQTLDMALNADWTLSSCTQKPHVSGCFVISVKRALKCINSEHNGLLVLDVRLIESQSKKCLYKNKIVHSLFSCEIIACLIVLPWVILVSFAKFALFHWDVFTLFPWLSRCYANKRHILEHD